MLPLAIPLVGIALAGSLAFNSFLNLPGYNKHRTDLPSVNQEVKSMTTVISWDDQGNGWWRHRDPENYDYEIKIYDTPSKMGIDGGRISKLTIKKDGKVVVHYDRGWDIPPKTQSERNLVDNLLWEIDKAKIDMWRKGFVDGLKGGKENAALEIAKDRAKLKQRLLEEKGVLKSEYASRFKKYRFDFDNKCLISEDGTLALQWQLRPNPNAPEGPNNQQTTTGRVYLVDKGGL